MGIVRKEAQKQKTKKVKNPNASSHCISEQPASELDEMKAKTPPWEEGENALSDYWQRSDPSALINVVPLALQNSLLGAQRSRPELFGVDERTLWKRLREEACTPNPTDNRLRIQFWFEYEKCMCEARNFNVANVVAGVCSRQYFDSYVVQHVEKLAWIMCPPASYVTKTVEALDFGLDRLRDILEMDMEKIPPGQRARYMELQAKIVFMLDQRVRGGFTQKIENRNMNLNVQTTDKQVAAAITGKTMEELDQKIKELERRERRALNLPEKGEPIVLEADDSGG